MTNGREAPRSTRDPLRRSEHPGPVRAADGARGVGRRSMVCPSCDWSRVPDGDVRVRRPSPPAIDRIRNPTVQSADEGPGGQLWRVGKELAPSDEKVWREQISATGRPTHLKALGRAFARGHGCRALPCSGSRSSSCWPARTSSPDCPLGVGGGRRRVLVLAPRHPDERVRRDGPRGLPRPAWRSPGRRTTRSPTGARRSGRSTRSRSTADPPAAPPVPRDAARPGPVLLPRAGPPRRPRQAHAPGPARRDGIPSGDHPACGDLAGVRRRTEPPVQAAPAGRQSRHPARDPRAVRRVPGPGAGSVVLRRLLAGPHRVHVPDDPPPEDHRRALRRPTPLSEDGQLDGSHECCRTPPEPRRGRPDGVPLRTPRPAHHSVPGPEAAPPANSNVEACSTRTASSSPVATSSSLAGPSPGGSDRFSPPRPTARPGARRRPPGGPARR